MEQLHWQLGWLYSCTVVVKEFAVGSAVWREGGWVACEGPEGWKTHSSCSEVHCTCAISLPVFHRGATLPGSSLCFS